MPIKQLQLQCAVCDAVQPHNQETPNHVVHALVSLFLIGLWIPVWILISIGDRPSVCVKCGNKRKATGPATVAAKPAAADAPPMAGGSWTPVIVIVAVVTVLAIGLYVFGSQ